MPDSMDCCPSVSVESASFSSPCISSACWSPCETSVCSPSSSSSYDSGIVRASSSSSLDFSTHNLYGSAVENTARATNMDSRKSASDLVAEGAFVQSNKAPRLDQNVSIPGEQPKIVVTKDASVTPDYIVRKDGNIEVVGNPDAGDKPHSLYRVQVEEGADAKTTEALVSYLNDRIHQKDASAGISLAADPGLVSDEVASRFNKQADSSPDQKQNENPDEQTPPADDSSPNCPGGGGGGGGGCDNSPSPQDDTTPEDSTPPSDQTPDAPPQPDAPQVLGPMDGVLEAARLNNWDNNTNGSLGAYEINAGHWFSSWLDADMMEELGHPPDYRKLGKILAKHKNDPKFKAAMNARLGNMREQGDNAGADKIGGLFDRLGDEKDPTFAENFGIFLNSQRSQAEGGRNATGEEMQTFFDKDLQKAIASSRMADVAHDVGVKIKDLAPDQQSKIALAGALGHPPSEKELQDYNKYLQVVASKVKPNKPGA